MSNEIKRATGLLVIEVVNSNPIPSTQIGRPDTSSLTMLMLIWCA